MYFALATVHMRNLVIRVTIEKSYGYGLYVSNVWDRSVITDSCFISNNEYVGMYVGMINAVLIHCIDPEHPASCDWWKSLHKLF